mgnify:FL=1
MILATILSVVVLAMGWPRRNMFGGFFFITFSISVTVWLITATIESFVIQQHTKILWSQIMYIGYVQANPYLFLFLLTYVLQRKVPSRFIVAVMIIPALTLVMAWTNSVHGWLWSGFTPGDVEANVLIYHHGFWFWLHTIYLYFLLLLGATILLRSMVSATPTFRKQLAIILVGILFPVITGTIYAFGWVPIKGLDITPTGLAFTGAFLAWGLLRYQLLELMPVAKATLIEQLQDGVVVLDMNGRIVDLNRASQKLLGWDPKETVGKKLDDFLPETQTLFFSSPRPIRREIPLPDSPGIILEIQGSSLNNRRKEEVGRLLMVRGVTARHRAEEALQNANQQLKEQLTKNKQLQKKLEQQALHDSLTGLFNRHIDEILEKEFSRARREKIPVSLALLDIDHFKSINDKFGHQYGDLLLKSFSRYISSTIREEDLAARFGGDEILLVFPGMEQADAVKKAEEIRRNFITLDVHAGTEKVATTITVGVATFPQNGKTLDEVIRSADWALYAAKEEGRNRVKALDWSE